MEWELLRRLGLQRVAVVCAPDDMWHPRHHYEQMQVALPGIEVSVSYIFSTALAGTCQARHPLPSGCSLPPQEYFNEALQHAFCCSTEQSSIVAHIVHASVSNTLAREVRAAGPVSSSKQVVPDARVVLGEEHDTRPDADKAARSSQQEADGAAAVLAARL